jgi:hypothetical protein
MVNNEPSAIGVFDDLNEAERSIEELRQAGFRSDEIGIIGHVGMEQQSIPTPLDMKAPEWNATHGVVSGGICGALIGILVMAIIPGLGWLSGAGRWFEILGGAVLGAAAGGVLFAIGSFMFSGPRGRYFEHELEKGRFIVTVKTPHRREEAVSVLRRHGHAEKNPS